MTASMKHLIQVARGQAEPDLVLANCRILNVFSGAQEEGNLAITDGRIAGVSPHYTASNLIDCQGLPVSPGLIDAHVHIESSLCSPQQFGATALQRGVTTVMADPHEIANVAGVAGIRYMHACSQATALDIKLMASSCVPASHLETSGAALDAATLLQLQQEGIVHGLAEMMNYPGVVHEDDQCLAILQAFQGLTIDGHAPQMTGQDLNAYLTTGIGSDHECTTAAEAAEKMAKGMYILIREGTITRDLEALLPLVTPRTLRRFCFCTDDRIPADLLSEGSVDFLVRTAVTQGLDPADAICMATLNPAEWFQLSDRGAIAPGRRADLVVWSDLETLRPVRVLVAGQPVVTEGELTVSAQDAPVPVPPAVADTVQVDWDQVNFEVPATGSQATVRVIGSIENQIVTDAQQAVLPVQAGLIQTDPTADILKIAMIERHGRAGTMATGFIRGFGLQRGALAGTIAHDHHNLVVIGVTDEAMRQAAHAVTAMGGGLAVTTDDAVIAQLPLPLAGLMTDAPLPVVRDRYRQLQDAATALGGRMYDPFMAMSFMGLEVVPKLKITDQGLVDVDRFALIPLLV